ncbi:decaprenyl-phosphate phosphoribosyltransferase [Paeniglutamicibacter cryotolerans]|uniref:Decaprenyl-phosphate phosphoribosyltransferase n=1 Tax=Paeniglutamicibacter cryotolerans TaxID=670079 RepID=A0A839QUD6_9MICC|nr:decaprenyl-phosphate phosphoribosyltransferase [Paeniglutamicibacter cryotolerans]MBB2997576.1 decaprenyl-phosphate phosphoribosyltransferase [Paeniglutamicibacter cryotolerans]
MTEFATHLPAPTPRARLQKLTRRNHTESFLRMVAALFAAARPTQWPKNLLLFAAPAAAGVLSEPHIALQALAASVAFTLGSAATYFLNDLRDLDADRSHPTKCRRPLASGRISAKLGYAAALFLAAASMLTAMTVGWMTFIGLCTYLALTTSYSLYLKRFPVIDILVVAMGFVLRAGTGALATGVVVTSWFLLVTFFGALYIVTAKRQAELQSKTELMTPVSAEGLPPTTSRTTLSLYTKSWLEQTVTLALTSAIICYSLWAVQHPGTPLAAGLIQASILPFVATLLRYGYLCSRGDGQRPEHLMFSDGFLAAAAITWMLTAMAGIYLAVSL